MKNPYQVVKDFEAALCEYTGAPYAVTTSSATMALLIAVAYFLRDRQLWTLDGQRVKVIQSDTPCAVEGAEIKQCVEIPKFSYVSVPQSIIHAGGRPTFRDEDWVGAYQLKPLPVWDAARWFSAGMYDKFAPGALPIGWSKTGKLPDGHGQMVVVSFHWSKTLGIQQGGAILLDDPEAARWLRMARFDGREEGVAPKDQKDWIVGWHCYMAPEIAAEGLTRIGLIPRHNEPLPWDDYPDLSQMDIFR